VIRQLCGPCFSSNRHRTFQLFISYIRKMFRRARKYEYHYLSANITRYEIFRMWFDRSEKIKFCSISQFVIKHPKPYEIKHVFLLYNHSQYLKNTAFWDVSPCGSCKNRRFGGTYCLHPQGENNQRTKNTLAIATKYSTLRRINHSMSKEAIEWDILHGRRKESCL
jgi:hypothetical protein